MSNSLRPESPALPDFLPGYRFVEQLGEGGMGAVYKARHLALDRWVAVKVMRRELSDHPDYVKRFLTEARIAGRLRHENLVSALDCGGAGGRYYIVMEFIEGRPLDAVLQERGRLPEREALALVAKVAEALEYAWKHRIIHRDIKPQNILVTPEGTPKICDLGLSRDVSTDVRLTATGAIHCTPAYASPEQARGERDLDTRTDVYSLGVTLYHLVTGRTPFEGNSIGDLLIKQATHPPRPPIAICPSLSPATNALILEMMEKRRNRRLSSPGVVVERVREILAGKSSGRRAPAPAVRVRSRRSGWIVGGVTLGFVILVGLVFLLPPKREIPVAKESPKLDVPNRKTEEPGIRNGAENRELPKGSLLAFAHREPGQKVATLCVMSMDKKVRVPLMSLPHAVADPEWSPDGEWIVFRAEATPGQWDLYLRRWDGSDLRRLTETSGDESRASWAPDGRRIVYASERDGRSRVCVMEIATGKETIVTPASEDARRPAWAGDERWIGYISCDRTDVGPLQILAASGYKKWSSIRFGSGAHSVGWARNRVRVACVYREEGRWVAAAADPEKWKMEFSVRFDSDAVSVSAPSWDPNGPRFALSVRHPEFEDLYVVDVEAKKFDRWTTNAPGTFSSGPSWTERR